MPTGNGKPESAVRQHHLCHSSVPAQAVPRPVAVALGPVAAAVFPAAEAPARQVDRRAAAGRLGGRYPQREWAMAVSSMPRPEARRDNGENGSLARQCVVEGIAQAINDLVDLR